MSQHKTKKRLARVKRELKRHGTPKQGHGWAARQAAKHSGRGVATSVRKIQRGF